MYRKILITVFVFFSIYSFAQLKTPLEKNNYTKLTTNSELMHFINEVAQLSNLIKLDTLILSAGEKPIPIIKISNDESLDNNQKIRVLIFAQQHGNEHSGKEASFLLLKQIVLGKHKSLFDNLDLLLIPQLNPDGNDKDQRRNGNDVDLNRNHLILSEPETLGLHKIFRKYMPEVTLDVHEYTSFGKEWLKFGYRKNFDIQVGKLTNPNISSELRNYQNANFLPFIKNYIENLGFSFNEYIVGGPPNLERIRYSTVDINDGRQSFGILNTLSFIYEGIKGTNSLDDIRSRTECQYNAMVGLIEFAVENKKIIKKLVSVGREKLQKAEFDNVSLQMEHVFDREMQINLLSTKTGSNTNLNLKNFHTKIENRLEIKKPLGYLIPKENKELLSLVQRHGLTYKLLSSSADLIINQYIIKEIIIEQLEDLQIQIPEVQKNILNDLNLNNYVFIPIEQLHSIMMILMFEPESMMGILQYKEFTELLKVNRSFPILRAEN